MEPQQEKSVEKEEILRLDPPRQALHILPFMYLLFTSMAAHYLFWYGPNAAVFRYGVVAVAVALAVHFVRMIPNLTNRYELNEEGIRILSKRRERFVEWEKIVSHLLRDEWLTFRDNAGRRYRIRLSLFPKPDQFAARRLVERKLGGRISP
jgi:hypothetical protein